MLKRLLLGETKVRGKRNVVLERRFSQLLEASVIKWRNRAIDSTLCESARAQMRVAVARILKKFRCPPNLAVAAVGTVFEHEEALSERWVP